MSAHIRRKAPGAKEAKRKVMKAQEAAEQRPPLDPLLLAQYRQEASQAWQAVKAAYPLRQDTAQAWKEWQAAVHHQYGVYKKYASLYFPPKPVSEEAAPYDWDFWRDIELLRGGDDTKLELAIAFLEVDPWFHGSGYAKVRMIRYIKPQILTRRDILRLQNVVLNMVAHRNGQDFRAYCRLARKVDGPEMREELTQRLTHADANVRRRAKWVLEALGEKVSQG